jgi:hypothetical protein
MVISEIDHLTKGDGALLGRRATCHDHIIHHAFGSSVSTRLTAPAF